MPICQIDCPPDMHHNVEYIRRKDSAMTKYLSTASQLQYDHPILPLLFGLEVVEKDRSLLRLLTPILDDNARAVDNFACVSLAVQHTCKIHQQRSNKLHDPKLLTQTSPLAQLLSIRNFDQGDLVF